MRDFIEWLYNTEDFGYRIGYVESRYWRPGGPAQRSWYPIHSGFECLIQDSRVRDNTGHEVYIGVLPRISEGGGDTEHVSPYTGVLWADVDANDHDGSKRLALDAVLDFPVTPQVIVDSGHGVHAYWKLDHLYLFDDVQPIMKGIAKRIGGDAVYDRARILRLPGLSNHKDAGNAPVRLLRFDTTSSFLLSDLAEFEYREFIEPIWSAPAYSTAPKGGVFNLDFDPGKGARSEHDFAAVCWMIENGWNDAEIAQAFFSHPQGIGAKTANKGHGGIRYLERTIRKAHQAVGR
jgi:hypothetical protein